MIITNFEQAYEKLNEVSTNLECLENNVESELAFSLDELRKVYNMVDGNDLHTKAYFKRVMHDLNVILTNVREKGFY